MTFGELLFWIIVAILAYYLFKRGLSILIIAIGLIIIYYLVNLFTAPKVQAVPIIVSPFMPIDGTLTQPGAWQQGSALTQPAAWQQGSALTQPAAWQQGSALTQPGAWQQGSALTQPGAWQQGDYMRDKFNDASLANKNIDGDYYIHDAALNKLL